MTVIIFFLILSQAEGNYLVPKIIKQQVGLSPIITILALLVGALLAIPLAAAVQAFITRIIVPAVENAER